MTAFGEEELDDSPVFTEAVAQSILGHFHRNVEDTQFVSVARFGQQFTYGVGIFHLFLSLESRLNLSVQRWICVDDRINVLRYHGIGSHDAKDIRRFPSLVIKMASLRLGLSKKIGGIEKLSSNEPFY